MALAARAGRVSLPAEGLVRKQKKKNNTAKSQYNNTKKINFSLEWDCFEDPLRVVYKSMFFYVTLNCQKDTQPSVPAQN